MRKKVLFKVDGKNFGAEGDLDKLISFEVRSVPRAYKVIWNENDKIEELIKTHLFNDKNNLLLIDENVFNLYCGNLDIPKDKVYKAKATEEFKTLKGVVKVIDFLGKNNFTKGDNLIVAGGGIIQDVGAFACALYKRGIPWIYIPTTLLSMCDSCIGGKAGVNHNNAKNQLALFSAPSQVIINPGFLKTLKEKEIISGLGEIIKLHITGGKEFLKNYLKYIDNALKLDYKAFKPLILGSLSVKKAVIEEDEFELNYRRVLNYGHTIGHAVEALSNYGIPHGQAVIIGMIVSNELSHRYGRLDKNKNSELKKILYKLIGRGIMDGILLDEILALLKKDKKVKGNTLNFAVLNSIGNMGFLPLPLYDKKAVKTINNIFKTNFGKC